MSAPGHRYCSACKSKCSVPECDRAVKECGYCSMHYSRFVKHGQTGSAKSVIRSNSGQCMIVGCEGDVVCNSLCNMHYRRLLRTGELGPVERKRALVGSGLDRKGYRVLRINGHEYKEHRLVMERVLGRPLLANENVHHLDGNKANNDPSNLELWVKVQPCGQRATHVVKAALGTLKKYPELVSQEGFRLLALESQEATDLLADEDRLIAGMSPAVI